ncbi:hypothetical protein FA95DRAFT_1405062 [Auriscalpium vulgare]|uniref:Uncharacterized protein n=1 Tax=Auriscalpium vulgare TaxID=40419 RepID=A0ACB8RR80_9AGAM|nr:hypothetical protein FA95DRAFT_1405062 [Auriscalpium vulgare]
MLGSRARLAYGVEVGVESIIACVVVVDVVVVVEGDGVKKDKYEMVAWKERQRVGRQQEEGRVLG